jgi:protein O-mannosyl-transferase
MKPSGKGPESFVARFPLVRFRAAVAALVIALVVALVFGRAIGHDFLYWDDNLHVTDNRLLHPPSWASLAHFWTHPYVGLYVPVSYTLFLLEAALTSRPDPHVFHAANVVLHAACAWLVFRVLRRCVKSDVAACAGALVFAVHPLQVESVAWISETRGTLSALFGLLALEGWVAKMTLARAPSDSAAPQPIGAASRRPPWLATLSIAVFFALALLSKPSAVAIPLIALVLAVFVLRLPARRVAPWILVALGLSALELLLTKSLQPDDTIGFVTRVADRPRIAFDALGFYLHKLVLPVDLGPDYGRRPAAVLAAGVEWGTMLLPLAFAGVALSTAWLRATLLPGIALFTIAVSPVLGLVPFVYQDISTVADRYAYLPMIGVALSVALVLDRAWPRSRAVLAGAALLLAVLAGLSFRQVAIWRDTETLFARALEINPKSWVAHTNRGMVLLGHGDRNGASSEFQHALELRPDRPKSHNNVGITLLQAGRAREALPYFERALELKPTYANAHANLAVALFQLDRAAEAEQHARAAIESEPEIAAAHNTLANILAAQNRTDEALDEYDLAVELAPGDADAQRNYALLCVRLGQTPLAIEHYAASVAARPEWADPAIELAWLLIAGRPADVRDPGRALALLERVRPATPEVRVKCVDARAAANAALGRFDEAVKLAREALTEAEARVPSAVDALRSRLARYEAHQVAW